MTSPAGIGFLSFSQPTPSASWTISHTLGGYPVVEVQAYHANGTLDKAYPQSVSYPDTATVVITWSTARAGFATLIG